MADRAMKPIPLPSDVGAFMARFAPVGDCLEWQDYRSGDGYGIVTMAQSQYLVHRVVWTIRNGPIPEGLGVLHHCDNPPCAAEEHLYLGTKRDNARDTSERGRHSNQLVTHCPSGHPYDEANTRLTPNEGWRLCRACRRELDARRYQRKKATDG